jgi:hypothetical protein
MKAMIIALLAPVLAAQSAPANRHAQLPPASEMKTLWASRRHVLVFNRGLFGFGIREDSWRRQLRFD